MHESKTVEATVNQRVVLVVNYKSFIAQQY